MNIIFVNLAKRIKRNLNTVRFNSYASKKPPWNVLFFGTDEFSLYSLKALYSEYKKGTVLKNLEVVTTARGKTNPVRKFANEHRLVTHRWPIISVPENFDVGVVVSFGHLIPELIINKFPFGMLNVHASLLPRWRGAAPIIYALANGDTETGVSIMKIKPKHFDVGEIICQEKVSIPSDMKLPLLHKKLGLLGAKCLVQSIGNLPESIQNAKVQSNEGITYAPKVKPDFSAVRWDSMSSSQICNLDRAVATIFPLTSSWNGVPVKFQGVVKYSDSEEALDNCDDELLKPGFVKYDKKNRMIKIMCAYRTWIGIAEIGVYGKKFMSAEDFNNGYLKKEPFDKRYFT